MEDRHRWAQQNAMAARWRPPYSTSIPSPSSSREECWRVAEQRGDEILGLVRPTEKWEERRRLITKFLQNLLESRFNCKVLCVGSVSLKTYLPDGDIDLAALTDQNHDHEFSTDVFNVLQHEENNKKSEFEVKLVQQINAEVKLVKCVVQDIMVDISINQKGGVSAVVFFELVDQLIGKDHLFKRSIIIIKAWCYYESRILGAHYGLISTYALEILILYIFNLFHKSLSDPLMVLFKFLDYFSKFDWDNYSVSLHGRVSLSSLPLFVVESTEANEGDLLLTEEFLKSCSDKFIQKLRCTENRNPTFPTKNLNIIDPLKENNNLGRSISVGNLCRIRCALARGAQKAGEILKLPPGLIVDGLNTFFKNTCEIRQRPCQLKKEICLEERVSAIPVRRSHEDSLANSVRGQSITRQGHGLDTSIKPNFSDLTGDLEQHLRSLHRAYGVHFKSDQLYKIFGITQLQNIIPDTTTHLSTMELPSSSAAYSSHVTNKMQKSLRKGKFVSMKSDDPSGKPLSTWKVRSPEPVIQTPTAADSEGSLTTSSKMNLPEKSSQHPSSEAECKSQLPLPTSRGQRKAKNKIPQQKGMLEDGSFAPLPLYAYSPELVTRFNIGPARRKVSSRTSSVSIPHSGKDSVPERPKERFQLNDDDFPPLS